MTNLPNNTNGNDDVHLLAGAYVVNAVDDLDRRRFEQHLESCPTCQDEVASLSHAVEGLAQAAYEPAPASMKSRVLAEIDGVRQVSPLALRTQGRRSLTLLSRVAAVALVLGLGAFALQQRSRANTAGQTSAIVRASDARLVVLAGDGVSGRFTYSASLGAAVVVTDGLSPAANGRTYQLWIVEAGTPRSLGTFSAGSTTPAIRLSSPPSNGAVIAITNEPAAGSPRPTSTPVLTGEVA
jgi:anti-sigma-K factor RskA